MINCLIRSQEVGEDGCGSDSNEFELHEEGLPVLNGWSSQTNSSLTKDTYWTSFLFFNQPVQKEKKKFILELNKDEYVHGIQTRYLSPSSFVYYIYNIGLTFLFMVEAILILYHMTNILN